MNKTMNGGGLILPYNNEKDNLQHSNEIFTYYLENADTVSMLSYGTYGYVFLVKLPDTFVIDETNKNKLYKKMVPNAEYGEPVRQIVVKFQLIIDIVSYDDYELMPVKLEDFQNEINIQTDITFKTLNYLQPFCPSIVYADVISDITIKKRLFNLLIGKLNWNESQKKYIRKGIDKNKIGIIAMELVYQGVTLNAYSSPSYAVGRTTNPILATNMSRYLLLKLALDTGYNHGDFHKGNIMIVTNNQYFRNLDGSPVDIAPMILDFGRTKKIPVDIMAEIRKNVDEKKYRKALAYLCNPEGGNEFIADPQYKSHYGWVCGNYNFTQDDNINIPDNAKIEKFMNQMRTLFNEKDFSNKGLEKTRNFIMSQIVHLEESIDIQMDQLFTMRELAIDELVKTMNSLHDAEPDKYPLLPVSNSLKNSLYNGMIGGGKGRRKRRRRYTNTKKIKNARIHKSKKSRRK